MITKNTCILILCLCAAPLLGAATTTKSGEPEAAKVPLTQQQKDWLESMSPIISDYERNAFLNLKTSADQEKFIEAFWEDRDPTPGTKRNEFREEYEERLKYVKENFNREGSMPAWRTDRGRIWLALGKPQFRKRFPEEDTLNPVEFWQYRANRDYGLPESFYVLFYQKNGFGPYRLYSPASDGPEALVKNLASLDPANRPGSSRKKERPDSQTGNIPYEALERVDPELASASFSLLPTEGAYSGGLSGTSVAASEVIIAKLENTRNYNFEKREYVERILRGRPKVEVYYSLGPQDVKNDIYWFQSPAGYFMIDYAVQWAPDKFPMGQYEDEIYTSLTVEGTVQTAKNNITVETINNSHEIKLNESQFQKIRYSPFQYLGRRLIVPGNYKVSFIVKNNLSKSIVPVVEDVNIPDLDTASTPYFSKLLLVQSTEKTLPDAKGTKPFQFGNTVLQPLVDHKYLPNGTVSFFYQLFFPENSLPLYNTDLTLEYEVFQQGTSVAKTSSSFTEKFPQSQLVEGSINILDNLKLAGVNFGASRMVARLKKSEKVLCESEPVIFQIEGTPPATPWRLISGIPNFDSPFHKYMLAEQYIRLNQMDKAHELLKEAIAEAPAGLEATLQLMKLALKSKQYDEILKLSRDIEIQYPNNKDLLWILGWTYYGKNEFNDAVRFFERGRIEEPDNIRILNILADVYLRMAKYDKSLEMIQKSLALNPQQPDLIETKEKIQSQASGQQNNQQ